MASSRFDGRVALVTGAGSGIGRAAAIALAREGASVGLCGRREEPLRETARLAPSPSGRTAPIPMDASREGDVVRAFALTEQELGPVDVVIASHGINVLASVEDSALADWERVIATNLTGSYLVAREAVRRMHPRGSGRIVLVSSVSGRPGFEKFPGFAAYASSKYALTGLVEVLAAELAGTAIGIAMLCPAGVDTEMFRRTFPGKAAALTPDRAAAAILDLSDPTAPAPAGTMLDLG